MFNPTPYYLGFSLEIGIRLMLFILRMCVSRTGYVLRYAGCPITWCSKLQTEIVLSTAEAEYIALSHALREVIPTMDFLNDLKSVIDLHVPKA